MCVVIGLRAVCPSGSIPVPMRRLLSNTYLDLPKERKTKMLLCKFQSLKQTSGMYCTSYAACSQSVEYWCQFCPGNSYYTRMWSRVCQIHLLLCHEKWGHCMKDKTTVGSQATKLLVLTFVINQQIGNKHWWEKTDLKTH